METGSFTISEDIIRQLRDTFVSATEDTDVGLYSFASPPDPSVLDRYRMRIPSSYDTGRVFDSWLADRTEVAIEPTTGAVRRLVRWDDLLEDPLGDPLDMWKKAYVAGVTLGECVVDNNGVEIARWDCSSPIDDADKKLDNLFDEY